MTTGDLTRLHKEVMFGLKTQSEFYEEEDVSFFSGPMYPVMEKEEIISIDIPISMNGSQAP